MLTTQSALERILRPTEGDLPPEFARQLLTLQFSEQDQARYQDLSAKAQDGNLTNDERIELDDLLTTNDVLIILRAKASSSLNRPSAA
jgi:hypothetical protein